MRIIKYVISHKDFQVRLSLFCSSVLAFLLCAPDPLLANTNTLERIAKAEREVSYVGIRLKTFVSSRGTRTFEELIIHHPPNARYRKELSEVGERKRFEGSRDNERRGGNRGDNQRRDRDENRRDDRERTREEEKWRRDRNAFSQKEIALIAQNYNMEKSPSTEKIANYETDILTITPKFADRPTKRIFFARENGVILRVEDLDAEGILRAMSVYTRISFDAKAVERKWKAFEKGINQEIRPERHEYHSISLIDAEKILKTKPIQPDYLPLGFQLKTVHKIEDKKNTIHLIYADGLLGFSIFETTDRQVRRGSDRRRGWDTIEINGTQVHKHQRGPTYAFSWSSGDIHYFLFGAIPATEIQKVVESIIHKTNGK